MRRCLGLLLIACAAAVAGPVEDLLDGALAAGGDAPLREVAALGAAAVEPLVAMLAGDDARRVGVAALALRALAEQAAPGGRAAIVESLARSLAGEAPASAKAEVIRALGAVGGRDAVPPLAGALRDENLRDEARRALTIIPDQAAPRALAAALDAAAGAWAAALCASLGERPEPAVTELLTARLGADATVANAALRALARRADPAALPAVLRATSRDELADAAFEAALRLADVAPPPAAAEALAALAERFDSPARQTAVLLGLTRRIAAGDEPCQAVLLKALETAPDRARIIVRSALIDLPAGPVDALLTRVDGGPVAQAELLRVLAARRPADAARLLRERLVAPPAAVRAVAAELLGGLGLADDADRLLAAARDDGDETVRLAALRGALAVAAATANRSTFQAALRLAWRDEERALAAAGLIGAVDPAVLPLLEPLLRPGPQAASAAAAVLGLLPLADRARTIDLADRILALGLPSAAGPAAEILARLGEQRDVPASLGMVARWHVIGGWPADGIVLTRPLAPEREIDLTRVEQVDGRELRWIPVRLTGTQVAVDLLALVDPDENAVAYGVADIEVAQGGPALLLLGADDGVAVWLNDERVHLNEAARPVRLDDDTVPVTLVAGTNRLLLKVQQGAGGWGFTARLVTPDGRPLEFSQPGP